MTDPEQLFRTFLRSRRLKFTTERVAILRAAASFARPFEAEELLLVLREQHARASKATIYRTLKHLLDAGLLKHVYFGGSKQSHYDFTAGPASHDHLLDLDTGKIIPFSNELVVKLREHIAKKMGYTAASHQFQITGRRTPGKK